MTLWIFISDGGPMGFGYLGLPFTFLMNIGGVLSAVQLVRKSNRMSFLIINGIFAIVGICLTLPIRFRCLGIYSRTGEYGINPTPADS